MSIELHEEIEKRAEEARMSSEVLLCEINQALTAEVAEDAKRMQDPREKIPELPDDDEGIYFVKKKPAKSEVKFSQLNEDERRQFIKSKEKEWGSLREMRKVRVLTGSEARKVRRMLPERIVGPRWVHTWKKTGLDGSDNC